MFGGWDDLMDDEVDSWCNRWLVAEHGYGISKSVAS